MPHVARFGVAASLLLLLLAVAACNKKQESPSSLASAAPGAATQPTTNTLAPGALDSCLPGTWKSTRATLKKDPVNAEGGANVTMQVEPTGTTSLDFTPMAEIAATSNVVKFDFRYTGKATGTLKTPGPGQLQVTDAKYADMRVTASIAMPGGAKVALFKDTPLSQLEAMAKNLGGSGKAPASPAGEIVDSSPVFSASSYTCSPDTLSLRGQQYGLEWVFSRVKK